MNEITYPCPNLSSVMLVKGAPGIWGTHLLVSMNLCLGVSCMCHNRIPAIQASLACGWVNLGEQIMGFLVVGLPNINTKFKLKDTFIVTIRHDTRLTHYKKGREKRGNGKKKYTKATLISQNRIFLNTSQVIEKYLLISQDITEYETSKSTCVEIEFSKRIIKHTGSWFLIYCIVPNDIKEKSHQTGSTRPLGVP